jgi:protocatechuate 3,4-dioxygenase beta subunit
VRRRQWEFIALAVMLMWPSAASAQTLAAAALRGRVLAAADGAALPRARLVIDAPDRPVDPVLTDDEGRFVLPATAPRGPLRVVAAKPGYATRAFNVERDGRDITLRLERGAAINGRVVDTNGDPVPSVPVVARFDPQGGGTPPAMPLLTDTDDLGEYRLGALPAGRYSVTVLGSAAADRDPVTRLQEQLRQNPAATLPDSASAAVTVALQPGEEANGIDLTHTARAPVAPAPPVNLPDDQKGTASVSGRVTSVAGRPLANATVRLSRNALIARVAVTTADGRYILRDLPAGSFSVQASKTGHVSRQYGQERPNAAGRNVVVRDGALTERIDIVLPGGSAMSGTVVDDRGEPVAGVTVRALQLRTAGDMTMALTATGVRPRPTDDRGQFRLFGLLPGSYVINASADASVSSPDPKGTLGYAPIFYPGTPEIGGAFPIAITAGSEVPRLSLVFIPSRTARVTGVALDGAGQPARSVLLFASQRSSRTMLEPRIAQAGPDGSFSVANVPPGEYTLQVLSPRGPAGTGGTPTVDFGMQYVTVADSDPAPVTVRATAGSTLEGRIISESGAPMDNARVWALPTDFDKSPIMGSGPSGLTLLGEGRFRITGVTGSRRFTLQNAPDDWYLKSVTVNGSDALDTPFDFGLEGKAFPDIEAVLAPAASVTGRAVGDRDAPVTDYAVLVFARDRLLWYRTSQSLKFGRPSQDGTFRVGELPPGDYWVVAVDTLDVADGGGEWQNPELLEELAKRAERITLRAGEARTLRLPIVRR